MKLADLRARYAAPPAPAPARTHLAPCIACGEVGEWATGPHDCPPCSECGRGPREHGVTGSALTHSGRRGVPPACSRYRFPIPGVGRLGPWLRDDEGDLVRRDGPRRLDHHAAVVWQVEPPGVGYRWEVSGPRGEVREGAAATEAAAVVAADGYLVAVGWPHADVWGSPAGE